jgi:hypothetical protein
VPKCACTNATCNSRNAATSRGSGHARAARNPKETGLPRGTITLRNPPVGNPPGTARKPISTGSQPRNALAWSRMKVSEMGRRS